MRKKINNKKKLLKRYAKILHQLRNVLYDLGKVLTEREVESIYDEVSNYIARDIYASFGEEEEYGEDEE